MGSNLVFPTKEIRQKFVYKSEFVTRKKHGSSYKYPVIVLCKASTSLPIFFTGLEVYIIADYVRLGCSDITVRKKTFCVLEFLNWVLHQTPLPGLDALTVDVLSDFFQYEQERMETDYWNDIRESVCRFLKKMIDNNTDVNFKIKSEDLIEEKTILLKDPEGIREKLVTQYKYESFGVKAPIRKRIKNRYLPYEFLEPFLSVLEIHYPELVLAVELQAFGGLREGEVVNLSFDKLSITPISFGARTEIEIDLFETASFWANYKGKTNPGRIKKPRIQKIYPDFTSEVDSRYSKHLDLMNEKGFATSGNHPIFVNNQGKPLTVQRYSQIIRETFTKHFIPYMDEKICYADDKALLDSYKEEYPGAHMFRHWFTMYLLTKTKNGTEELTLPEIMRWRGDSSITSMNDYIHESGDTIKDFRKGIMLFQENNIIHIDSQEWEDQ